MPKHRIKFYYLISTPILIVTVFCCLLFACKKSGFDQSSNSEPSEIVQIIAHVELGEIIERGYITAIMDNSSTGLFLYKGRPMGYEYELLSLYAESLGIELRFEITPDLAEGFEKLNNGYGDILAYNLTITKKRKEKISFTQFHNLVKQVLIQRKPDNWRDMKLHEIEKSLVRNTVDLIGQEVYVRKSSSYVSRLKNLSDEIGGDIMIIEDFPDLETEGMIRKVANGEIKFTVADEDVALVNARYYPNIDVKTAISFPQQIAWGVRKNADSLRMSLNGWIEQMKKTPDYYAIYDKYFKSTKASKARLKSDLFSMNDDQISPYDSLIKNAADEIGWDWRMLAAQISKESKFDPKAKSWAGALGLMQLIPINAKEYGIKNIYDPAENIRGGKEHIKWLQGVWKKQIADTLECQKFILASYNVGLGHVEDAVRLTKKYGNDTLIWDGNVAEYILKKTESKYYNDPVVKYGYCRGEEPFQYVIDILTLYQQYQQLKPS
jgi:membrane-bound lytic murein transglycosylase F